jgi:hypothetical protein
MASRLLIPLACLASSRHLANRYEGFERAILGLSDLRGLKSPIFVSGTPSI